MIKKICIVFVLIFLTQSIYLLSQSLDVYTVPKEVISDFYPIGWSKDGKFAYIDVTSGGGRCYFLYSFYLKDMITDKIVNGIQLGNDELIGEGKYNSDGMPIADINVFWTTAYKKITDLLLKYKIIQSVDIKLNSFPIFANNDEITYVLDTKMVTSEESPVGYEGISSLIFYINSKKYGKKIIYKEDDYVGYQVSISGYIQSPFEQRIAVVLQKSVPGWEGPPSETLLVIIGCHLIKGF